MKIVKIILVFIIGVMLGYYMKENPNAKREYGESGFASNCRALIYENEEKYYFDDEVSNEDLLKSIFRNCGETGHLWENE